MIGFLIPNSVTIVLIIAFLASMVVFIIYLFPGYFETRKEFVKLWKQRLILAVTCVLFVCMILCFVLITYNLIQSIKEAQYTQCFYYLVQYDLISGLDEADY